MRLFFSLEIEVFRRMRKVPLLLQRNPLLICSKDIFCQIDDFYGPWTNNYKPWHNSPRASVLPSENPWNNFPNKFDIRAQGPIAKFFRVMCSLFLATTDWFPKALCRREIVRKSKDHKNPNRTFIAPQWPSNEPGPFYDGLFPFSFAATKRESLSY